MGYHAPTSLREAFERLAAGASVVAGGTDWYPSRGEAPPPLEMLDVTRLPGFRDMARTEDGWRFGAAVRWSDVIAADLPPAFDGLKAAAREVGSVQIQNAGTIAGNLCNASPAADGVPPLLALEASVELTSASGARRMPLGDFLTGPRRTALRPDELMTAIHVPSMKSDEAASAFQKLGARKHLVISIVMAAATLSLSNGRVVAPRVAVGACSAVAERLPALEAALDGRDPVDGAPVVTPAHLAPLSPIDDMRADAAYRLEAAAVLCRRVLADCLGKLS